MVHATHDDEDTEWARASEPPAAEAGRKHLHALLEDVGNIKSNPNGKGLTQRNKIKRSVG